MTSTLSDKKMDMATPVYHEKDVREFIRQLKSELDFYLQGQHKNVRHEVNRIIDKKAGPRLTDRASETSVGDGE